MRVWLLPELRESLRHKRRGVSYKALGLHKYHVFSSAISICHRQWRLLREASAPRVSTCRSALDISKSKNGYHIYSHLSLMLVIGGAAEHRIRCPSQHSPGSRPILPHDPNTSWGCAGSLIKLASCRLLPFESGGALGFHVPVLEDWCIGRNFWFLSFVRVASDRDVQ